MTIAQGAFVFFGAGIGGVLRWLLSTWMDSKLSDQWWTWSVGTMAANILGSFLIGLCFASSPDWLKHGVLIGILGGFTTFSSFSLQSVQLLQQGRWLGSCGYILSTTILCLLAAGLGLWLNKGS